MYRITYVSYSKISKIKGWLMLFTDKSIRLFYAISVLGIFKSDLKVTVLM